MGTVTPLRRGVPDEAGVEDVVVTPTTTATLWTGTPHQELREGEGEFRIGTFDGSRYHYEDVVSEGAIMKEVKKLVPSARWLLGGSNYVMVVTPAGSLEKLQQVAAAITDQVDHDTNRP